jgi:hypothetical protein
MLSNFICAHPRCPKNPDLPAIRYAIREFMEEQAPSNFTKERWKASYDPARKVTYCSWFLGTLAYFLDRLEWRCHVRGFYLSIAPGARGLDILWLIAGLQPPNDSAPV